MKSLIKFAICTPLALGFWLTAPTIADAQNADDLHASNAPTNALWLDTLELSKVSSEWQTPQAGHSIDKNPLTLGGVVYPRGIGTHAQSQMTVDLKGIATRFRSMVGVDDEKNGHGSVVFTVWADGKKIYDSGEIHGGDAPKLVDVDITGVQKLVLAVGDAEDAIDSDHADWAGAMLLLAPNSAFKPATINNGEFPGPALTDAPLPIFSATQLPLVPAIHGPRVTGATPGRDFLFKIPATGQMPLTFRAENLPTGLTLNPFNGVISGSLKNAGTSVVKLTVLNEKGKASRNLTIVGGEHKLAQTPPMGWNSWNIYYCGVDEKKVRDATDWIIKTGLDKHGYQYVNIDDCWQADRAADGEVQDNKKFGDMKVLSDYVHGQGLKFGIYSSPGPKTCAGYTGSYQHEEQDAKTYAKWGVDYLKYDWCSYGDVATGEAREKYKKPYRVMGEALDKCGRDIVYSLCQYGMDNVWEWGADANVHGNLWRTTGDIGPSYKSMAGIGFSQAGHEKYAGPGHWNDPDMLFVHALKPNEQITHISLWSLLAAPLLIGSDISKLDQFSIDVLNNDEVIEVDQDPLGQQASRVVKANLTEVWVRPLWDGTLAVGLFNRGVQKTKVTATWADLKLQGAQNVRDLWAHKDLGKSNGEFSADVPGHGAILVKIGTPNAADYKPKN